MNFLHAMIRAASHTPIVAPAGYVLLVDDTGRYLLDSQGRYLIEAI